jgi:hypothetical protein
MFKRFLSGFITFLPFVCLSDKPIRYFPKELFRNDWKSLGYNMRKLIKTQLNKTGEKTNV